MAGGAKAAGLNISCALSASITWECTSSRRRAVSSSPSDFVSYCFLALLGYYPQQYFNWRAYLDFGGGQVTDLFTHWIDVVHMFMGQEVPSSASAAGGVYKYK